MSRIFKVCVLDHPVAGSRRAVCVKNVMNAFWCLEKEVFGRFPELEKEELHFFYNGRCSHIVLHFFVSTPSAFHLIHLLCSFKILQLIIFSKITSFFCISFYCLHCFEQMKTVMRSPFLTARILRFSTNLKLARCLSARSRPKLTRFLFQPPPHRPLNQRRPRLLDLPAAPT